MKLLLCVIFGVTICCIAIADEKSLEASLNATEDQLERLYAEYWRADWQATQGHRKASRATIRSRILSAVSEPSLLGDLKSTRFDDPLLERRRELFLQEYGADIIEADTELALIVESISRQQSEIRFRVGKRRLTRAQLEDKLSTDKERASRRTAWEAQEQAATVFGDSVKQAVRLRNTLSLRHSGAQYADAALARKGLSRAVIIRLFEEVRTGTDAVYQSLLKQAGRQLGTETIEPWDLAYYLGKMSGDVDRRVIGTEGAWTRIKRFELSLGFDFGRLPVELRTADMPFGGATYPILYGHDVKMLVNHDHGIRFTETVLHETGHALHYSLDNETSFLLRAGYSEAFDEGLGQVMALMLYEPPIATAYFGLTMPEANSLRDRQHLESLIELREYMADSLFEFAMYDNPDQDLTRAYGDIYSKFLGVNLHGREVWAYDPFYGTDPIYLQNYVLAEMMARQVHRYLHDHFGTVWGEDTGRYLKEKLYSRGGRFTLDQIVAQATGRPLSPEYLIAAFEPLPYYHAPGRHEFQNVNLTRRAPQRKLLQF